MKFNHLLIDADSLLFKAGCANETRWYEVIDTDGSTVHRCQYKKDAQENCPDDCEIVQLKAAGDLSHSISNLKNAIQGILDAVPCNSYKLFIGGGGNFRTDLYPEYKQNRSAVGRPIHEEQMREYMLSYWDTELVYNEEADDKVSYLHIASPDDTCILGVDKDLWNTPGHHWNYGKGEYSFLTLEEADRNFWTQMITGDSSDNIPGLPGFGPAKAKKVIDMVPHSMLDDTVYRLYQSEGFDDSYFLLQGRLLWLRRKPQELWTPSILEK